MISPGDVELSSGGEESMSQIGGEDDGGQMVVATETQKGEGGATALDSPSRRVLKRTRVEKIPHDCKYKRKRCYPLHVFFLLLYFFI